MKLQKRIFAIIALLLALIFIPTSASAGVLFGKRAPSLRTKKSTAVLARYAQPGKVRGTYGTAVQLAKVVKVQHKAYKKALKRHQKEVKKAQKIAKKRAKERKKLRAKEAKRQRKLAKKLERQRRRKERLAAIAEDEEGESTDAEDGSIIVKDDAAKKERSIFSKFTGSGKKPRYKKNKLDKDKLGFWSRFWLAAFGD